MKRFLVWGMALGSIWAWARPNHRPPIKMAKEWGKWNSDGCAADHIQIIQADSTLAVLFDDFGLSLRQGVREDGMIARKTCRFSITLTPPEGMTLGGFRQVYTGGLIKTKKSQATLRVDYRVANKRGRGEDLQWRMNQEIRPDDAASIFEKVYQDDYKRAGKCRDELQYEVNLVLQGNRQDKDEYVVGGLDSIDASVSSSVRMEPAWIPCREGRDDRDVRDPRDRDRDRDPRDRDHEPPRKGNGPGRP